MIGSELLGGSWGVTEAGVILFFLFFYHSSSGIGSQHNRLNQSA